MARVNFAGYKIGVPGHPLLRMGMGVILVLGGIFGFLPVLGFWMIPLGLAILAVDFPPVRRLQRRLTVRLGTGCTGAGQMWRGDLAMVSRANSANVRCLEASPGIEPGCKDLQSSA
jgi:hypothetical protein